MSIKINISYLDFPGIKLMGAEKRYFTNKKPALAGFFMSVVKL